MGGFSCAYFCFIFLVSLSFKRTILGAPVTEAIQASTPPRGWNSYDSFCWTISEEDFIRNAELVAQRLGAHGYEYAVVDYLWYRRKAPGAGTNSLGFDVIDEWGRMVPDPDRWPSSRDGKGFTDVANKVHGMGLKFGIHVMRGLSIQAFNVNTPILDISTGRAYEESGRKWYAKDIGIKERTCAWMQNGFMSVNTKLGAGRAFLRSLYQQYANWGVDFVKNDCIFGTDLDVDEITYISEVLKGLHRPILYSLSPGTSATPTMAKGISGLVNMYRVTGDDWDTWGDVAAHFDVARDFAAANMMGAKGLRGRSWPDLDMLPLGWLTDANSNEGPHRTCNLTLDEQRTQMTLWSMAKSPLMFGGDMRNLDDTTFRLITNPTILEINTFSSNNMEFPYITNTKCQQLRNRALGCQSGNVKGEDIMKSLSLGLTSCEETKARGWSSIARDDNQEQVCWKENSISGTQPFCLYKSTPRLSSNEIMRSKQQYDGKVHLLPKERRKYCLGASPHRKLTSKEFKRGSISPCRWNTNQMWELNNGTLSNSYSGLCASLNTVKANPSPNGVRAWIATGRKGEVYVAFFNLYPAKTVVSTKITDLAKALPGRRFASCNSREEWSGKDFGMVKDLLSIEVASHGTALFVLICT